MTEETDAAHPAEPAIGGESATERAGADPASFDLAERDTTAHHEIPENHVLGGAGRIS